MDYLPLAFNLREARVLLVGAGVVAARKATLLKKAGASLHVVALTVSDACRALLDDTDTISERAVVAADLDGVRLIIAATDARELHVCLAESPSLCTTFAPSPEVSRIDARRLAGLPGLPSLACLAWRVC